MAQARTRPGWLTAVLRVPLAAKLVGANAVVVAAAITAAAATHDGGVDRQPMLVILALRPVRDLEGTAARIWRGDLAARVPPSPLADRDMARVGKTLNLVLDGLVNDRARLRQLMDGTEATRAITAGKLPTRVLVLTMHAEDDYLMPAIQAGAAGYLVKSAADRELADAVRGVAHGDGYFRASAARVLARALARPDPMKAERDRYERLTDREKDVLRLVAEGYSAPEIGEQLFISPKTVDTYKQRIGEKLGLARRADYVQFALRLGVLTARPTTG